MGFFQRLFSPEFRRAVAAEAQGDYLAAARSYALCGELAKVTDMHLAQARQEQGIDGRIRALRNALAFAPAKDDRRAMVERLLARALQERGRERGADTSDGRRDLLEAAALLEQSEAWGAAGDAFLELGAEDRAAAAFAKGGLLERVESMLAAREAEEARARRRQSRFEDYQLLLTGGQREAARAALHEAIDASHEKGELRTLAAELDRRRLSSWAVLLAVAGQRVAVIGRYPLVLGRDADCTLSVRGPSVSRRHAKIEWDSQTAAFTLEDCESRNGTLLAGVPIGAPVPLPTEARIGLGDSCALATEVIDAPKGLLRISVEQGIDRGTIALVTAEPCRLDAQLPDAPATLIAFEEGVPSVEAVAGHTLTLDGARIGGAAQLIIGDVIEVDGKRIEVLER